MLDVIIMKLDTGNEYFLRKFNNPNKNINYNQIISGLSSVGNVTIQSLLCGGEAGNSADENINAWIDSLRKISPAFVQIYTLDRDTPSKLLKKLSKDNLVKVQHRLINENYSSEVY